MTDMDFAFYSDVGGRANNEDSYIAKQLSDGYLFIVADGLGGHDDGEIASSNVVNTVKKYLIENQSINIVDAICTANDLLLNMQAEYSSKMKTTIALAYVTENKTLIAHVGDSRVYAFKNNKLILQTIDHSASQLAVKVGEITPEEIRSHADRNILLRAVGAAEHIKVELTELHNDNFDALLLCSDGFWEYVLENEMEYNLSQSDSANKWLYKMRNIQLERAPENCDNNTAIAVMI